MAIVKIPLRYGVDSDQIAGLAINDILNNAAGEAWAFSFQIPKTGTIEAVVIRAGTVTSFQNMAISLETVGTDGLPSGSNYGSSTAGTWTGGSSNTSPEIALGTNAAATVGDLVCVRGEWSSTAGDLNVQYAYGASATAVRYPKVLPDTGSGFVLTTVGSPMICLKYSGSEYIVPVGCYPPLSAATTISITSTSTPQEIGFWITPQVTCEVEGGWINSRTFATSQTSSFTLYTTPSGTPASQRLAVFTHDQQSTIGQRNSFSFNPYTMNASTDYVLGCLQNNTTSYQISYIDVTDVNHWGGWAGGSNLVYASRNSGGGAFTKTSTRKVLGSLLLSGVDAGGGGLAKLIGNNSLLG